MSDRTLRTLIAVSRSKPVERELCCPNCDGPIELIDGVYECPDCIFAAESLAELAVREVPRG